MQVAGEKHERKVDLNFATTNDLTVRIAGKDAKLTELQERMPVRCKFAADRRTVSGIWAGPPKAKEEDDDKK